MSAAARQSRVNWAGLASTAAGAGLLCAAGIWLSVLIRVFYRRRQHPGWPETGKPQAGAEPRPTRRQQGEEPSQASEPHQQNPADALAAAEEALRQSEQLYHTIARNIPHGVVCVVDQDLRCLALDGTVPASLGRIAEHPEGRPLAEVVDEETLQIAEPRFRHALGGESASYEIEHHGQWLFCQYVPLRGPDRGVVAAMVLSLDITPRKQAEQARHDALAKLDRHLANSPLAIIEWDGEYRILSWNPAAERIFGWSASQVVGQRAHDLPLVYEQDWAAVRQLMSEMSRGIRCSNINCNRNHRRDGSVLECEWHNSALYDEQGRLRSVLSLVADVTQRNRIQRELATATRSAERAIAAAEQANRAKDHFLATLSHELRTPLTPLLTTATLLEEDGCLPEHCHADVQTIRRNVELEARLIDDLLDVTRIARGKVELTKKPVELAEVIGRAVEVCQGDIQVKGLHFKLDMGDAARCTVHADAPRLQQVFWNLLKNAIKFTPQGGWVGIKVYKEGQGEGPRRYTAGSPDKETRGQGEEGTARRQNSALSPVPCPLSPAVVVQVSDSGVGIDAQTLPHVFTAFEQGERGITRQFGGLGLGLTIAKALVDMHGGNIHAHSDGKGRGATFTVSLPVAPQVQVEHGPATPGQPGPATPSLKSMNILLVEDHGDTARAMQRLLTAHGHQVTLSADVAGALQLARQRAFDLLISDLGLPDGSGLELMRQLRRRGQTLPAIALSGYGQDQDVRQSRAAGFAVHLTKPVSLQQLQDAIAAACG